MGSNPTHSAICKGSGHQRNLMPGFFANGVVYWVVLYGQGALDGGNALH